MDKKSIKRTALRAVSQKRQAQLKEYRKLLGKLYDGSGRSEWNGDKDDWYDMTRNCWITVREPHHIDGRTGARLLDPFNIILLTPAQHRTFQAHNSWEVRVALKLWVRGLRLEQGFKE
jgi:hypothetical protein